jgi:hypothetical protein
MRKLLLISLLLVAPRLYGTITLDATSVSGTTPVISGTTITWNHTVTSSGSNRALFVLVGGVVPTQVVTGVTYNGVAMTNIVQARDNGNSELFNYIYVLVNPSTGTNSIVVTWNAALTSGGFAAASAISFTGVNQTNPNRFPSMNFSGTPISTTMTVSVTDSKSGDYVIGTAVGHASTITQGGGQTAINTWNGWNASNNTSWATAYESVSSPATSLSWTQTAGVWSVTEVAVRPDTDTTSYPTADHFIGLGNATGSSAALSVGSSATVTGFQVGSCSNSLLLVMIGYDTGSTTTTTTVSSVTFNGSGITGPLGTKRVTESSRVLATEIWYAKSPPNVSANVVVTWGASVETGHVMVSSWCNVNQTTPFGTVANAGSATASSPSVTVTSTSTSYVIDVAIEDINGGDWFNPTGQLVDNFNSGGYSTQAESQVKLGAASTTMNWTGSTDAYSMLGVGINPVSGASSPTAMPGVIR